MKYRTNSQAAVPNFIANSSNFGIDQSKFNDHFQGIAGGGHANTIGRHMSNPYKNISQPDIRPPSLPIDKPFSPQLGRHSSNPNAQKNLQFIKNI